MADPTHNMFIFTYSNLIAKALGLAQNTDMFDVTERANKLEGSVYVPKKIKVKTPEEEKENPGPPEHPPEDEDTI